MAARVLVRGQPWIAGAVGFMALAAPDLASNLTGREGASRWRCWRYGHNRHSPALDDCRWRRDCLEIGCGGRARSIMAAPDRRQPIAGRSPPGPPGPPQPISRQARRHRQSSSARLCLLCSYRQHRHRDAQSRPVKSLASSGAANVINPTAPAIQGLPRTNTLGAIASARA